MFHSERQSSCRGEMHQSSGRRRIHVFDLYLAGQAVLEFAQVLRHKREGLGVKEDLGVHVICVRQGDEC